MKLLFIILAHNQPEQLLELATTLATAASDGRVLIHYDAHAKQEEYALLWESLKGNPRITLMKQRVHCRWGTYSLVEATLLALTEARAQGYEYDYATLLSGACLPCRPMKQLERFLKEKSGLEFIEADGPEWIFDGLREERYIHYAVLSPAHWLLLEDCLFRLQRILGIKRQLPAGIPTIRFGSQWWCLTRETCLSILDFIADNPSVERFFRKTWIPDEMFFNTLVHHLVPKETIAGYNLTYYQFTNYGKPVVFYDDHGDHPFSLDKFFYRKVSPEAKTLRRRSLERAREPDGGGTFKMIGCPNSTYETKVQAQTFFPVPGHLYYRDQLANTPSALLRRVTKPYVVVFGALSPIWSYHATDIALAHKDVPPDAPLIPRDEPYVVLCDSPKVALTTFAALDVSVFEPMGRPFMPKKVNFGQGRTSFHGLQRGDAAIRDLAPALYFSRILKRCGKIPVFLWMPGDSWSLVDVVRADPRCRLREVRQC